MSGAHDKTGAMALYLLGETLHALADRVTIGHFPDRTGSRHRQKKR